MKSLIRLNILYNKFVYFLYILIEYKYIIVFSFIYIKSKIKYNESRRLNMCF